MKAIFVTVSIIAAGFAFAQDKQDQCCAGEKQVKAVAAQKAQCCQSTTGKTIAKAGAGCCNEKGQLAKFKVFVAGSYKFYGCEMSAKQARMDLIAQGKKVGKIQPVRSRVTI